MQLPMTRECFQLDAIMPPHVKRVGIFDEDHNL